MWGWRQESGTGDVPGRGVSRALMLVSLTDVEGPSRKALCETVKHLTQGVHAMALDQSALIDLLEALKTTDVDARVRTATEHLYKP